MKPLEALEKLTNYKCSRMSEKIECKEIIENALNDNHFYKHIINKVCDFMGLDINPFEDLVKTENEMINYIYENECFRVDIATNKKKLKAFDIIKTKRIDVDLFIDMMRFCLETYNEYCCNWAILTQEEYDLLKEVLQ